jgi:hypothetical protein
MGSIRRYVTDKLASTKVLQIPGLAYLCAIYGRVYSDCGSREGRGFEPRRSPSQIQQR